MVIKRYEIRGTKNIFSYLVLLTSYLVFFSCTPENENPPPADLIAQAEMVSVITDLTLSEAALAGEPLAGFNDTLKKLNVLKEHKLDKDQFLKSFKYYTENPSQLKTIYDSVIVVLTKRRADIDTLPGKKN